ncbi:MAG: hypothetical protein ACRDMX_00855 [Solirubrobacteraceae bacterium]
MAVAGVLTLAAVGAPPAFAAVTPSMTLDQSAGTAAGATHNLGMTLKFAPTGTDSPHDMTLSLPPGLLANATVDGGACLTMADISDSACQVGNGTVTAYPNGLDIPITTPVTFHLVAPPAPGDLAGLAVASNGTQIGQTADIKIRPSGDPAGVGVTLSFVLPNTLDGVPISISQIASTFDGLRYPTTCPSTPAPLNLSVDSYDDPTPQSASAPLTVTGCSALPFAPKLSATVTRDPSDKQVTLSTDITQAPDESPSSAVALGFPVSVLTPNLESLRSLCPTLGPSCQPVGSATTVSPLYPKPLTGQAYLTGAFTAQQLTLVFPSPFPLQLTGKVDLAANGTMFTGLPDIPLTDLKVVIDGGPNGLFKTDCRHQTGAATATLTDQNGDEHATASGNFTITGCPAAARHKARPGKPRLTAAKLLHARSGHASLSFGARAGSHAAKLSRLTVGLPRGLKFVGHRSHHRMVLRHVSLRGARLRSEYVSHGRLVLVLRHPSRAVTVRIAAGSLRESRALHRSAERHHTTRLTLKVGIVDAAHRRSTVRTRIAEPGVRRTRRGH